MSSLGDHEYVALRDTIATRGTVRMLMAPLTIFGWAALLFVSMVFAELPIATLLSLAVLAAGFEGVLALHLGVERIGRYLQVFYEEAPLPESGHLAPRWETTAMAISPALPGGGVDPLFSALFLSTAVLNMVPALLLRPVAPELAVIAALHVLFVARVLRARTIAARQRSADLEHYRRLKSATRGQ